MRWLRPEFQSPQGAQTAAPAHEAMETAAQPAAAIAPRICAWPPALPEQIRAVAEAVAAVPAGLTLDELAAAFSGRGAWKKRLPPSVESLEALGRVRVARDGGSIALVVS